jgi:hypothetical protein
MFVDNIEVEMLEFFVISCKVILFNYIWCENKKYITIFNLLFIVIFSLNNLQKQISIFDFRFLNKLWITMNLKIFVFKDFEVENGMLLFIRSVYLSIVKLLY